MPYTISTHNGSKIRRQHNLRNPNVVAKQAHIREDGVHETWYDQKPQDAYREIFDEAQEEYNRHQREIGRPGRCIKSYYSEICKNSKKHPVYEIIVAIGSKSNPPPANVAKEILREFSDTWHVRNESLKMIGSYYHLDEEGIGHVHIDYIPVAHGYKNGMKIQTGLARALNDIGFVGRSSRDTAQIQWQRRENQVLEELCKVRGIEVEHPLEKGRKHLSTEDYKLQQEFIKTRELLESQAKELKKLQDDYEDLTQRYQNMLREGNRRFLEYKAQLERQEEQIKANEAQIRTQKQVFEFLGGDPSALIGYFAKYNETQEESIDFDELIRNA